MLIGSSNHWNITSLMFFSNVMSWQIMSEIKQPRVVFPKRLSKKAKKPVLIGKNMISVIHTVSQAARYELFLFCRARSTIRCLHVWYEIMISFEDSNLGYNKIERIQSCVNIKIISDRELLRICSLLETI